MKTKVLVRSGQELTKRIEQLEKVAEAALAVRREWFARPATSAVVQILDEELRSAGYEV